MNKPIPFLQGKLFGALENRVYPRQEIDVKEFREISGQTLKTSKDEWIQVAKDLEQLGLIKPPGNHRDKIEIIWPTKKRGFTTLVR